MKILCIILATILLVASLTKIVGLQFQKNHFRQWNLPVWSMYLIGVLELIASVSILFSLTALFGLILSCFILFGAIVTCWVVYEYKRSVLPFALLLLAYGLLWQLSSGDKWTMVLGGLIGIGLLLAWLLWLYPATPMNTEGEKENLQDGTTVTHHFKNALGVDYHYVEAGNKNNSTVVIIPGAPESWYCFHYQIAVLSKKYHVIALDLKPYGQTGKDQNGDHTYAHIAKEIKTLLDKIEIKTFYLMGHDRGTVAADHLLSIKGMTNRIIGYIRMQQSFNEPHGEPVPPHHLMGSFLGTMVFKIRFGMWVLYNKSAYTKLPIPPKVIQRITKEFQFKGIAQAVPLSFKTTSFPKELKDREEKLFAFMTMPILILQGRHDPGQHPEEYEQSHTIAPDLRVKFIDAGHFFHLEAPEKANEVMLDFLNGLQIRYSNN